MAPGSSEVIASMDMASHLIEASSGAERVLIDGETHRQGLALRHGFGEGWEYLFEVSALSHRAGAFDGFIETWHDVFHLPQGDRDRAARDRLALVYANGGRTYYDIGRSVSSLGDVSLGVGYAVPYWPFPNDGLAIRGSIKLPTGDEASLAGSGGRSASLWAETSGALPGSTGTRSWLYSASLGALAGEAPSGLSDLGGHFLAFGHLGVTWRPLNYLSLTVQLDAHSSPYGASDVAPPRPILASCSASAARCGSASRRRLRSRLPKMTACTAARPISACTPRSAGDRSAPEWRPVNRPETVQGHAYEITMDDNGQVISDVADHPPAL